MALEDLEGPDKFLANLVRGNPTDLDPLDEGDDHIRGIKNVVLNSFGIMTGLMAWPIATPIDIPGVIEGTDSTPVKLGRTLLTTDDGADLDSESPDVILGLRAAGLLRGSLSVDPAGDTRLAGVLVGGTLALGVQGAGGTEDGVEIVPDAGVGLNFAGVRQVDTIADGVQLKLGAVLKGTDSGLAEVELAAVIADESVLGELARPTLLRAPDDQLKVSYGGGEETSLHTGNIAAALAVLVDSLFPVGSMYFTVGNSPPAFGGTWERIAEGRFLVSEGLGTDGGATDRSYSAGADGIGRYEVQLTEAEMPSHTHSQTIPQAALGASGDPETIGPTADLTGATGGDQAHENSPPAFGLFAWERTA